MITRYSLRNYMRSLVDRFFKILPLWEDGEETLPEYLDSMLIELSGFRSMMFALHHDQDYVTLIAIVQYLIDNPGTSARVVKREVFRAISCLRSTVQKKDFMRFGLLNRTMNRPSLLFLMRRCLNESLGYLSG